MSKPSFIKRHKILTGFAVLLLLIVVYLISWRTYRIASIPDVGEPFDVEAYLAKFDVEENAYDVFREAMEMRREALGAELYQQYRYQDDNVDAAIDDWSAANEETKEYLELCRPAMAKWREANSVEFGYEFHPSVVNQMNFMDVFTDVPRFEELFLLEIARLRRGDRFKETWPLIRDLYRLQKHYRQGGQVAYRGSVGMYGRVSTIFSNLLGSDQFSINDLRSMQAELRDIHETYPPVREVFYNEYFGARNYHDLTTMSALNWLSGETEVFRRTQNLLFTNWLAHFDDPPDEQPEVFSHDCDRKGTIENSVFMEDTFDSEVNCGFDIYRTEHDPDVAVNAFHNLSSSWVALSSGPIAYAGLYRTESLFRKLNLTRIALQIHYREQGHFPEQLDVLVPDYLDEVPTAAELDGKALLYEPGANSFELSLGEPYREE